MSLGGASAAEHASRGTSGTGAAKHVPPDVIPASKTSAEILRTLPQGIDEKAMRARNAAGAAIAGGNSTEPLVEKRRLLQDRARKAKATGAQNFAGATSRLQKSRVRFKSIVAEKTLVLQSTLIARRPRQTLRMRASAGLGLKLPLRKMVFGFSVTARAM